MRPVVVLIAAAALALSGCAGAGSGGRASSTASRPPPAGSAVASSSTPAAPSSSPHASVRPDHVVIAVMENRSYADVIASPAAPFINSLAESGALFTQSFAVTHPSEPNYLALFSGSTQGLTDDSCPHTFSGPNLAAALRAAGATFTGYSDSLPEAGFTGCSSGPYARKHVPWTDFSGLPAQMNQPFTAFPSDYAGLPTVSFVIPDLDHDMHDGTIAQGDRWLQQHLGGYVTWASTHNSLLVVTWDEDDRSEGNQIPTIIAGAHVRAGEYGEHLTHYRLLRTVQSWYGLTPIGQSASTEPVTDIWAH